MKQAIKSGSVGPLEFVKSAVSNAKSNVTSAKFMITRNDINMRNTEEAE